MFAISVGDLGLVEDRGGAGGGAGAGVTWPRSRRRVRRRLKPTTATTRSPRRSPTSARLRGVLVPRSRSQDAGPGSLAGTTSAQALGSAAARARAGGPDDLPVGAGVDLGEECVDLVVGDDPPAVLVDRGRGRGRPAVPPPPRWGRPRRQPERGVSRWAGGVAGPPGRTAGRAPAPTRATARASAAGSVRSAYASSAPAAWVLAQPRRPFGAAARYAVTASWAAATSSRPADASSPRRARSSRSSFSGSIGVPFAADGAVMAPLPPDAPPGRVVDLRSSVLPSLLGRVHARTVLTPASKCRDGGLRIPSAGGHKCAAAHGFGR